MEDYEDIDYISTRALALELAIKAVQVPGAKRDKSILEIADAYAQFLLEGKK